ncbi:PaaI family thioesterase [Alicyclobacillus sp. ALC3]|uniref:PaaI family thioesterase n=1 Tax=Alicyclobacillus sp. ALC3 TaxID=2796143 RepID=UPI002379B585|nr:PaaI family thioesterase [Alicyclobacillus sp. ALC3]WDL95785.1 PaaI family thioesterase [Alicyclobacillus sp. ALC3]
MSQTTNTETKVALLEELTAFDESDLAMALHAAKASKRARERTDGSYFLHEFLGEHRKVEDGQATLTLDVKDWMMNPGGILHGGVMAFLCDNTLGMASFLNQQRPGVTVDLNVRYHLPVTSGVITGRGTVVSSGSRINSARSDVFDEAGRLVASATGTFYHVKR